MSVQLCIDFVSVHPKAVLVPTHVENHGSGFLFVDVVRFSKIRLC